MSGNNDSNTKVTIIKTDGVWQLKSKTSTEMYDDKGIIIRSDVSYVSSASLDSVIIEAEKAGLISLELIASFAVTNNNADNNVISDKSFFCPCSVCADKRNREIDKRNRNR